MEEETGKQVSSTEEPVKDTPGFGTGTANEGASPEELANQDPSSQKATDGIAPVETADEETQQHGVESAVTGSSESELKQMDSRSMKVDDQALEALEDEDGGGKDEERPSITDVETKEDKSGDGTGLGDNTAVLREEDSVLEEQNQSCHKRLDAKDGGGGEGGGEESGQAVDNSVSQPDVENIPEENIKSALPSDLPVEAPCRTEHKDDNQSLNNNIDATDVGNVSEVKAGSILKECPMALTKDVLVSRALSPEVVSERVSSDGGSVEIAEEADEECGSDSSSNIGIETHGQKNNPPVCMSETDIQHSTGAAASLVTVATECTSPSSNLSDSQPPSRSDSPTGNTPGQNLGSERSKDTINIEDELLCELAAELDSPQNGERGSESPVIGLPAETDSDDHSHAETTDNSKLRKLVEDWKKKYCHAEAKLQSLQAAVQAQSTQHAGIEQERDRMELDVKRESEAIHKVHLVRIKELEREAEQRKKELAVARERQVSHDMAAKKAIGQLQQEMVNRVDQVKRRYEEAVKEKETMVIRYAKSEKENLDLKKAKEGLERKRRDAGQGLEVIASHNKQLKADRAKLMADLDAKDVEIARLQQEMAEMKDDVSSVGIKVKWAQNKLKTELEAHKETKVKLGKTEQRLQEAKEETEQIRKNCQEMIKTYQESEEIRSNSLDLQLKEKEEELKLHFQEKEDHMELHNTRLKELEVLKKTHHDTLSELDSLKVKSKCLEDERQHTEGLLGQFKGLLNSQKEENRKLSKQMDELKALKRLLDESKEKVGLLEQNVATQKEGEKDLEAELSRSRSKESELLQFTERMTAKNASLHSDNSALSTQVDKLTEECRTLKSELEEARTEISQLSADLNQERQYREREAALLSARLSEKTVALDQVKVQLDDAKDETKTLKRKHAANLKDLTRQLLHAKKKLESLESDGTNTGNSKDTFSSESRTSSTGSLDTLGNSGLNGVSTNMSSGSSAGGSVGRQDDSPQASQDHTVAIAGGNDFPGIDKAMLVDRIVKLQRQLQRKTDKMEFLQEHSAQLVEELQKKSKIIQQYIMREEAGALAPAASDANKAQMSKQSGIMASLYRSHSADPNMTLDLSLEINRKLQSVLEDTLLKNITLKENIDTLGQEIARLSEEARSSSVRGVKPGRRK